MQNQTEQVIKIMRKNGGYATFGQLNVLVDVSLWKTKTPYASIRRIVQQNDAFFKVRPGLWALNELKDVVLEKFQLKTKDEIKEISFTHSYYQGLVVEIGNMKKLQTYIPPQDKNKLFLEKPLKELASLQKIHDFTYPEILNRATSVDVIWFNDRKLPHSFFEIEHSTDIQNSLTKFYELQDYYARFYIVAPQIRKKQFEVIMNKSIFLPLKHRVDFFNYDFLALQYSKMFELSNISQLI